MQHSAPAREPLRGGRLLWGILLLLAAPAFAIWIAVVGLLSAFAAANITVNATGSIPVLASLGQSLLSAFAYWATFISAGAGLIALILLGVQSIQAARRPAPASPGPTFAAVLWAWALAIPLATGFGALVGTVLAPVADSIGTDLSLDAGPGTGINYDDAVYGLMTGGAWLLAATIGLVLAIVRTIRFVRSRRQARAGHAGDATR